MSLIQSIIASSKDALFIAESPTGIIIFANEAAAQMFETTSDELVGKHLTMLHPPEDCESVREKFIQFVSVDSYKEVEARILTKSGKIKPVLISGAMRYEEDGKVYSVAFFKDMTPVSKLEEIARLQTSDVRSYSSTLKSIAQLFEGGFADTAYLRKELVARMHEVAREMDTAIRKVAEISRFDHK